MNNFKDSIKVKRDSSGKIVMTKELEEILIKLLRGEIDKKEAMKLTKIGDKETIEKKIQELIILHPELEEIYQQYISRKNANFNGYNFRAEAIDMLRHDYSRSEMAKKLDGVISRKAFSTKVKDLQEENSDNILGQLLKEHADRKMKRQNITQGELIKINLQLDEYEQNFPIRIAAYEKRNPLEVRLENYTRVLETIDLLLQDGKTLKQICEEGIISEGTYRKYREEVRNLTRILNNKQDQSKDTPPTQPPVGDDR